MSSLVAEKPKKFPVVLSLDGGGVRGVIQACVLVTLEDIIKEQRAAIIKERGAHGSLEEEVHLADYFDCIAGTSVGSILALFFAAKLGSARKAKEMICDNVSRMFSRSMWETAITAFGLRRAAYSPVNLEEILEKVFGDKKLTDLSTSVVVPAFEVDDGGPFLFFYNKTKKVSGYRTLFRKPMFYSKAETTDADKVMAEKQGDYSDKSNAFDNMKTARAQRMHAVLNMQQSEAEVTMGERAKGRRMFFAKSTLSWFHEAVMRSYTGTDFFLKVVARASSAAPTYFPAANVRAVKSGEVQSPAGRESDFGSRTMVDGGMIANNPTLMALTWICKEHEKNPGEIAVLSIGTGMAVVDATAAAAGGGAWHWKSDAVSVAMTSAGEALDAVIDQMYYEIYKVDLGQYLRVQKVVSPFDEELTDLQPDIKSAKEMLAALSALDSVQHMPTLLAIGEQLGHAYRTSLEQFVKSYLF